MYLERMIHVGVTVFSKMAIILVVMRANKKFIVRNPKRHTDDKLNRSSNKQCFRGA